MRDSSLTFDLTSICVPIKQQRTCRHRARCVAEYTTSYLSVGMATNNTLTCWLQNSNASCACHCEKIQQIWTLFMPFNSWELKYQTAHTYGPLNFCASAFWRLAVTWRSGLKIALKSQLHGKPAHWSRCNLLCVWIQAKSPVRQTNGVQCTSMLQI